MYVCFIDHEKFYVSCEHSVYNILFCVITARCYSTEGPELIEVFVDDKPVMVDPGCTVLQVNVVHHFLKTCFEKYLEFGFCYKTS